MSDTVDRRIPVFEIKDAERELSEPEWDVSALEFAVTEADIDPFDPVKGSYTGLRRRPAVSGPRPGSAEWARGARRWLDMRHWSAPVAFLTCLAIGIALLVLSASQKVAFKMVQGREVGFVWSPAWSIGCLALAPFAVYLMVSVLRWLPDIVEEMGERGMLSSETYQTGVHGTDVTRPWFSLNVWREAVIGFGSIAIVLLFVFSRIVDGTPPESWRDKTLVYTAAQTWAALVLAMFFVFTVYVADFTRILSKPVARKGDRVTECRLVPDLSSPDVRRGFEMFEGALQQLLMLGLIVFIACNLVQTDAAYLASPVVKGGTVWSFVYDVFTSGMGNPDQVTPATLMKELTLDLRTIALTLGAALVFLVGYLGLSGAVQEAAIRSARNARHFYRVHPSVSLSGYPPAEEREALANMKMRPLLFPTPYLMVSLFTVGLLGILFYRVGLYLFGVTSAVMIATVIVRFIRRK